MPKPTNTDALTLELSLEPRYFSPISSPEKSISQHSISHSIFDEADQLRAAIRAARDATPAPSVLRSALSFSPRETNKLVPTSPAGYTFHGRDAVATAVQAGIATDEPSALMLVGDLLEAGLLVPAKKESSGVAKFKKSELYVFSDEAVKGGAGVLHEEDATPRSLFTPRLAKKTSKGVHGNLDKDFAPVEPADDRDVEDSPQSFFMKLRGKVSTRNLGLAMALSAKDVHATAKMSNASDEKPVQAMGLGGRSERLGVPRRPTQLKKDKPAELEKRLKDEEGEEESVELIYEDEACLSKSKLETRVMRMELVHSV
eukprot:CAMPEP_0174893598 /NCGR_PEP_ID=MMETSP0167-20121228/8401_1 /TAXON_ID=38298 /ORGANISM="Rhodella maculata, Strain CCMP736" /LENGTH=314 /DNA_ID=CAMNT_0016132433 /DNA_START=78 /DNA_END=1022 /DNA_ORIENTATION=+